MRYLSIAARLSSCLFELDAEGSNRERKLEQDQRGEQEREELDQLLFKLGSCAR